MRLVNFTKLTPLEIGVATEFVEEPPRSLHIVLERVQLAIVQAALRVGIEALHAAVEDAAIHNSI